MKEEKGKATDPLSFEKAVEPVYEWFVKNVADGKTYLDMARAK